MKKLFILILAAMMAAPSFAQFSKSHNRYDHNNTESYYGLRLGMNIASLSSDNADFDMDSRAGLAFGAVYGLQLANSTPVWLEAGLFYSEKGGNMESVPFKMADDKIGFQKVKCRLSYLQIPLVVKYSFDIVDDLYIDPFLGGYLALGVGGKTKYYGEQRSICVLAVAWNTRCSMLRQALTSVLPTSATATSTVSTLVHSLSMLV